MEVFIVRPFSKKLLARRDKNTQKIIEEVEFDFDRVELELIAPALRNLNITGGTTGEIFESGDIREDMFSLLLQSDIVIADITIHNANVFYELGIRHALRDKKTILIRCPGFDDTPFDIVGYRYIHYSKDDPAASVSLLTKACKETMQSDRKDSPVFNILPKLEVQALEKLIAVPPDFIEEAEIAARSNQSGKLALLAYEISGFHWDIPASRILGEMFFRMKAYEKGRAIYEKIVNHYPNDIEANDRLATIYQRLAENEPESNPKKREELLARSDLAIEKLLNSVSPDNRDKRAEAYSLKGRNEKTRWLNVWRKLPEQEWQSGALKSHLLMRAFENYKKAYYEDLNHFYSGINALGLLTIIFELSKKNPGIWELLFESEEEAVSKLNEYQKNLELMAKCLKVSIDAAKARLKVKGEKDVWLNITEADFHCLTSSNPARTALMYVNALSGVNLLSQEATIRQLKIYEQLNVAGKIVKAVLNELPDVREAVKEKQQHYLLFTGHMIDKPDRKEPRFPASKEKFVKQKMKEEIQKVKSKTTGLLKGIAGGACGGDILFHEICEELEIPTEFYLALPREKFLVESVAFAGAQWIDRFDSLYKKLPVFELSQSKELPRWLQKKQNYSFWERNNLWELYSALTHGGLNMTLIALWDGKGGDAPGGTADMVKEAKTKGARSIIINPEKC